MRVRYHLKIILGWVILLSGFAVFLESKSGAADTLIMYCYETYLKTGDCPQDICQLVCDEESGNLKDCPKSCIERECPDIPIDKCPLEYCDKLKDCSGGEVCHYKMVGEKASCGDLSYAGQDVPCCPGLVRRCGVEFLDGSCDMEGINSIYNIPICISCGDGVCTQFEDGCNCPEDCAGLRKSKVYTGIKFDTQIKDPQEPIKSSQTK